MSILIKGMEMPTDNTVLLRIFPASENGECYVQQLDVDGDILTELWAVPVPKHGRLIDADALKSVLKLHHSLFIGAEDKVEKAQSDALILAISEVVNAPTVIEAEEGE